MITGNTILVVDDEPLVLRSIERLLRYHHVPAHGVDSATAALAALERERFSLLLCDVSMTPIDGVELVSMVEQRGLDLPVILLTGSTRESIEPRTRGLPSVRDIISKPWRSDALIQAINAVLAPSS